MADSSSHRQKGEAIHFLVFDLGLSPNHELVSSQSHDWLDRWQSSAWHLWLDSRLDLHAHSFWCFKCDFRRQPTPLEENPKRRTSREWQLPLATLFSMFPRIFNLTPAINTGSRWWGLPSIKRLAIKMNLFSRFSLLVATISMAACCPKEATKAEAQISEFEGVYATLPGLFDRETIIIHGDKFLWWFATDTNLPDVFPVSGTIHRGDGRLELICEASAAKLIDVASVFPPEYLVIEHFQGVTVLRSARISDPFKDGWGAVLLPTTLGVDNDRGEFPTVLTDLNTSPAVRAVIKALQQSKQD